MLYAGATERWFVTLIEVNAPAVPVDRTLTVATAAATPTALTPIAAGRGEERNERLDEGRRPDS